MPFIFVTPSATLLLRLPLCCFCHDSYATPIMFVYDAWCWRYWCFVAHAAERPLFYIRHATRLSLLVPALRAISLRVIDERGLPPFFTEIYAHANVDMSPCCFVPLLSTFREHLLLLMLYLRCFIVLFDNVDLPYDAMPSCHTVLLLMRFIARLRHIRYTRRVAACHAYISLVTPVALCLLILSLVIFFLYRRVAATRLMSLPERGCSRPFRVWRAYHAVMPIRIRFIAISPLLSLMPTLLFVALPAVAASISMFMLTFHFRFRCFWFHTLLFLCARCLSICCRSAMPDDVCLYMTAIRQICLITRYVRHDAYTIIRRCAVMFLLLMLIFYTRDEARHAATPRAILFRCLLLWCSGLKDLLFWYACSFMICRLAHRRYATIIMLLMLICDICFIRAPRSARCLARR